MKSQPAITDELILTEPEKVKKFKTQTDELIATKEKLEEELGRMKTDDEKMKEIIEKKSNESENLKDKLIRVEMK